jgi:signal transduction histidine kinase
VKSRIVLAIMGVAALLILVLGIPLGLVAERFYQDRALVELQRRAEHAVGEVTLPLDAQALTAAMNDRDPLTDVSVYSPSGRKLVGPGPNLADAAVLAAMDGQMAARTGRSERIVAAPVHDRTTEDVVGIVRVTTRLATIRDQVMRAWLVMGLTAILALVGAWTVARWLARQITIPLDQLRDRAHLLGSGVVLPAATPSGLAEFDEVDEVLRTSGEQIGATLARERAFSSDVSHQLRTPLTRLSMLTERALREHPDNQSIQRIDQEIVHTQEVVEHLLALARDRTPAAGVVDPDAVISQLQDRWRPTIATAGRELVVTKTANLQPVVGSETALGQALDVLVDNALRHGTGPISVHVRRATAAVVFEVGDDGPGIEQAKVDTIFKRHVTTSEPGVGTGIGLALARSIIEADDGRLILAQASPPRFHLIVRVAETE